MSLEFNYDLYPKQVIDLIKADELDKDIKDYIYHLIDLEELKKDNMFKDWLNSDKKITPPDGESSQDFTVRVCTAFDKLVEGMMKTGVTNSAVVTHGGIIMILLAVFGIPKANFNDWVVESGCGYSVRVTPTLWMRDKVMEVYNTIPYAFKDN